MGAVTADEASHTQTSVWTKTGTTDMAVENGMPMVTSITVTNEGPDPVDNVSIVFPSSMDPYPTALAQADNIYQTPDDNDVILPAGTVVSVSTGVTVSVPENTEFIRKKGTELWNLNASDNVELLENADLKVPNSNTNITLPTGTGVKKGTDKKITLTANDNLRLVNDTQVIYDGSGYELPTNAKFEVAEANTGENFISSNSVMLSSDNTFALSGNRLVTLENLTVLTNNGYQQSINKGTTVELNKNNDVVASAGTPFTLDDNVAVDLAENTEVLRTTGDNITPQNPGVMESQPKGWKQANYPSTEPSGKAVEWTDNTLAAGESMSFPVALTTPSAGGVYSIYAFTTDTSAEELTKMTELTMTIDTTPPVIEVSKSKEFVGENSSVEIAVESSEPLASLDNVVIEGPFIGDWTPYAPTPGPENVELDVSSNEDNTVFTGTYETGDNAALDGMYHINVNGATDDFNNATTETHADNFIVDKLDPIAPTMSNVFKNWSIDEIPSRENIQTMYTEFFLEDTSEDNFLDNKTPITVYAVNLKVGDTVTTIETSTQNWGYWTHDLALSEGTQQVAVQVVDWAGNKSAWTKENITVDLTAPSVTLNSINGVSPGDLGTPLSDNQPVVDLVIEDATLGIDNITTFNPTENTGYEVTIEDSTGATVATLTNGATYDRHALPFENTYSAGLADGSYTLRVLAGDNFYMDNFTQSFTIDTTPPGEPAEPSSSLTLGGSRGDANEVINEDTLSLFGGTGDVEGGSTVTVYVNGSAATTTTADADGSWSAEVDLSEGMNKIEVTATDAAGNESAKTLCGYIHLTVDTTSPTVSITAPDDEASTDDPNIELTASVSDEGTGLRNVSISAPGWNVPSNPVTDMVSDGQIVIDVPLTEGSNTITVTATDQAGNPATSDTITVTRTVEEAANWAMYATFAAIIAIILAAIAIIRRG